MKDSTSFYKDNFWRKNKTKQLLFVPFIKFQTAYEKPSLLKILLHMHETKKVK